MNGRMRICLHREDSRIKLVILASSLDTTTGELGEKDVRFEKQRSSDDRPRHRQQTVKRAAWTRTALFVALPWAWTRI